MGVGTQVSQNSVTRKTTSLSSETHGALPLEEKIEGLTSIAFALLDEVKSIMPEAVIDVKSGIDFYDEVRRFEIDLIESALRRTGGHQTRAADLLNIKLTTLNSKIKRYNIAVRPSADDVGVGKYGGTP
jgi:DNA-binding NtrC family response regulator